MRDAREQFVVADAFFGRPLADGQIKPVDAQEFEMECGGVPMLGVGLRWDVGGDEVGVHVVAHVDDGFVDVRHLH